MQSLVLSSEEGDLPSFLPGQHIVVGIDPGQGKDRLSRSFSLAGSPTSGNFRIGVKRGLNGVVSAFMHQNLKVGDLDCSPSCSPTFPDSFKYADVLSHCILLRIIICKDTEPPIGSHEEATNFDQSIGFYFRQTDCGPCKRYVEVWNSSSDPEESCEPRTPRKDRSRSLHVQRIIPGLRASGAACLQARPPRCCMPRIRAPVPRHSSERLRSDLDGHRP